MLCVAAKRVSGHKCTSFLSLKNCVPLAYCWLSNITTYCTCFGNLRCTDVSYPDTACSTGIFLFIAAVRGLCANLWIQSYKTCNRVVILSFV